MSTYFPENLSSYTALSCGWRIVRTLCKLSPGAAATSTAQLPGSAAQRGGENTPPSHRRTLHSDLPRHGYILLTAR